MAVDRWVQGEPVPEFEAGKIYIVEFWATWCGPCIHFMPDLAELQKRYKDQGVTCISFTARDPNNTEKMVAAFVEQQGTRLGYTFAYADESTTTDLWMKAAGREAIPCSFVVDRTGRIAHIGNPLYLGEILPLVIEGKRPEEVSAAAEKMDQEHRAVSAAMFPDHEVGLRMLKAFEAKYPSMTNNVVSLKSKLSFLPKLGKIEETKRVVEAVTAKAVEQGNPNPLLQAAGLLRNGPGKESEELLAVAVKAAEKAVELAGDQDPRALIGLADTYFVAGEKAKAREFARKALDAAAESSPPFRESIEQAVKRFDDRP